MIFFYANEFVRILLNVFSASLDMSMTVFRID